MLQEVDLRKHLVMQRGLAYGPKDIVLFPAAVFDGTHPKPLYGRGHSDQFKHGAWVCTGSRWTDDVKWSPPTGGHNYGPYDKPAYTLAEVQALYPQAAEDLAIAANDAYVKWCCENLDAMP
jgi:hypothetical protein